MRRHQGWKRGKVELSHGPGHLRDLSLGSLHGPRGDARGGVWFAGRLTFRPGAVGGRGGGSVGAGCRAPARAARSALVFASTIGTPMEPRNVNRRFEQLRATAGLEWLHLHDLRHAFATFLLDQGEELRTVMELLGHSTIRMTADTYGHVLPARARQAASAIDRILGEEGTA
ncbi:tyrosine-type recombinase/integrase [Micromonospora sp. DT178]|uniref:tyrosine-type recombinase/integrase n=1 Tax=Micromonospora sp. DT178 TaxID=3393436 RepID=UPI003CEC293E